MTPAERRRLLAALRVLGEQGPALGRPLVETITNSNHPNMKELRVGTIRILFAFDPRRVAVLLTGGDKRGEWAEWYREAIPQADRLFARHLRRLRRRT